MTVTGLRVSIACSIHAASTKLFLRRIPSYPSGGITFGSNRVENNEKVLFLRRWLSREEGESPSPVQAACWLDIKRTYMELRPNLRRVYLTVHDLPIYAPVAIKLGFRPLADCNVPLDGSLYHTAMLDFGPSSVDGWISGLVAAELGAEENGILDVDARELTLDGVRVDLTKLEFEVLHYLSQNEGKAISRDQLLDDVWGQTYHGGSNVVDVVIRALTKENRHSIRDDRDGERRGLPISQILSRAKLPDTPALMDSVRSCSKNLINFSSFHHAGVPREWVGSGQRANVYDS